jgi:ubiquitin C-terminal hydrolase/predicted N-acetyltransferase YhbS
VVNRTGIAITDFDVWTHNDMMVSGDDDKSLYAVWPTSFGSPSIFIVLKRKPELEGEEFDSKFPNKPIGTRRRYDATPPVTYGPLPHSAGYHSYIAPAVKSHTGFTGLSNQGATCYMNSLIQSLFMTPEFRSAVYNWSFIEHIGRRIEKLKATPTETLIADANNKNEDFSWLESAPVLLALWTRLEVSAGSNDDASNASSEASESNCNGNGQDSTPDSSSTASTSTNAASSSSPAPTFANIDIESEYESAFLKAVRAEDPSLHPHAVAFEKWKKSIESRSIPFQLRLLFAELQLSEQRAVSTKGLTKSFGWTQADAFTQHDVQELLRVLFDALETAWDGTPQHSLINELYQGSVLDYVKCSHCGYKSARRDTYLDLQLTVKPFGATTAIKSVEEALEKYVTPEILDGNNQYYCEQCDKKRDATKGLEFDTFPYLLTLQLKRFDYDWEADRRIKLMDRVSFPQVLNLNSFVQNPSVVSAASNQLPPSSSSLGNDSGVTGPDPSLLRLLDDIGMPLGVEIRTAMVEDLPGIIKVTNSAFGGVSESRLVSEMAVKLNQSELISLVAIKAGKIIGHLMLSPINLVKSNGESLVVSEPNVPFFASALNPSQLSLAPKFMGLGPISVMTTEQRTGVGSALMQFGIQKCLSWGVKAIFVLGHISYYTRFGFKPASQFGVSYAGKRDDDHFMALELSQVALPRLGGIGCDARYHPLFDLVSREVEAQQEAAMKSETDAESREMADSKNVMLQDMNSTTPSTSLPSCQTSPALSDDDKRAFEAIMKESAVEKALLSGPAVYDLFAVFVHRGSAQGGHYYAYVQDFDTHKWYEFNDSTVTEISKATVESSFGDPSPYSSGGTAYMLLYRQHDTKRNAPYPTKFSIPTEAIEAVEKEKKRKRAKEALKQIEAQKMSISVSYRGSRKEIRLHRDQTVLDALKMAMAQFQVTAPIEDARFHSTSPFARPEDVSVFDLSAQLGKFSRDEINQVQLQTRSPGTEFKPFDPRSMLFLVNVWDTKSKSWPPESYEVYLPARPTLGNLRVYVEKEFGIPIQDQLITKEKNSSQPVELITGDDDRSLANLSLWEKATLWVEPMSEELIDPNYKPSRRKKIISSISSSKATQYTSTITTEYERKRQEALPASTASTQNSSSSGSNTTTFTVKTVSPNSSTLSGSDEMNIVALGESEDDDVENAGTSSTPPPEQPASSTATTNSSSGENIDDGYEYFHDPKNIIINGQRIIPRSEDTIRNIQNRLLVRFTNIDSTDISHSMTVNKTDSVDSLRRKMATVLNVDPHSFIITKYLSTAELNDAQASIDSFVYGSFVSFLLKKGTPSLRGESIVKFEFFVLPTRTSDPSPPRPNDSFEASLCADKMSIKDAKVQVRALGRLDPNLPLEKIRLRKYGYDGHGATIGTDDMRLGALGNKILVQVLTGDQVETKKSDLHRIIILRQVLPECWEFGDAIEFCVPPGGTYGDVQREIERMTGLPAVECSIRPIYNVPQLNEVDKIDWVGFNSRLERTVSIMMTDGDYIFFRDPREQFKAISEEERRKLAKTRPKAPTYSARPERALTIKVDGV